MAWKLNWRQLSLVDFRSVGQLSINFGVDNSIRCWLSERKQLAILAAKVMVFQLKWPSWLTSQTFLTFLYIYIPSGFILPPSCQPAMPGDQAVSYWLLDSRKSCSLPSQRASVISYQNFCTQSASGGPSPKVSHRKSLGRNVKVLQGRSRKWDLMARVLTLIPWMQSKIGKV